MHVYLLELIELKISQVPHPQGKNSENYRSDVIHKITHSNPTPLQFYTLSILHSYNPTLLGAVSLLYNQL